MIETSDNAEARKGKNLVVQALMRRLKETLRAYERDDIVKKIPENEFQRKAVEMVSGMDFSACRTEKDADYQVREFWNQAEEFERIAETIYRKHTA